jgi:hypothetical protein
MISLMMKERNIAMLMRDCGLKYYSDNVMSAIPKLYPCNVARIDTRKGRWNIYTREGFVLPYFMEEEKPKNGFVAVYERNGKPQTLFSGELEDIVKVEFTAKEFTRNVLEQRLFFAQPPRYRTEERIDDYYRPLVVFFFLGSMIAGLGVSLFTGTLVSALVCATFGTIDGLVGLTYVELGLARREGRKADKKRVQGLLPEAASYKYGNEAREKIIEEYDLLQDEQRKSKLYAKLGNNGLDISKKYFVKIYQFMQTRNLTGIRDYLSQNPQEPQVPLEQIVNVFSTD